MSNNHVCNCQSRPTNTIVLIDLERHSTIMELVRNSACGSGEPALERATEEEIKRRNLELQLEAWGDSEAFEERFMHLYNKVKRLMVQRTFCQCGI